MTEHALQELLDALRRLPGVGARSAQRMAFHLLQHDREGARRIAAALLAADSQVRHCERCHTFTEARVCAVCSDPSPGKPRPGGPGGEMIPADNNPNNDPPLNDGSRVGLYLGGGVHVFLNDFLALDLTVRDYAFSDNPSGADYNADLFVGRNDTTGNDDNRFLHHLFFGAGISIMFPTTVKRTP